MKTLPEKFLIVTSERALSRIKDSDDLLNDWRAKAYDLRKLTIGDKSTIEGFSGSSDREATNKGWSDGAYEDILVTDIHEGKSNDILKAVRTLVWQATYHRPILDFPDLGDYQGEFNSKYFDSLMDDVPMGCSGYQKLAVSLADRIITGIGVIAFGWKNGRPSVKWVDSIRVKFDPAAKDLADSEWVGIEETDTVNSFVIQFGWDAVKPFVDFDLDGSTEDIFKGLDAPLTVVKYFDVNDRVGNYKVFVRKRSGTGDMKPSYYEEPMYSSENPCWMEVAGVTMPFLPVEFSGHIYLPGCRMPNSQVEGMIAPQIAVWNVCQSLTDAVTKNRGFYAIKNGSMTEEQLQEFKAQLDESGFVFVENLDSIKEFDGLKPHPSTMAWYSINNQDIIEQSGANPYAMGGGGSPNFASEVVAVNGNSGLTAGIIIKDHTLLVSRVARKLIAMGKINDNASFSIEIDGTKQMFGPANPPEQYLEPYTKIEVSEDTHAFMPRDARIQEARENLMLFMKLASVAPQMFGVGVLEATRRYLRAMGITNIKPWMTNAGGQGGAAAAALPSMMDPAMQAGNGLDPADEGRLGVRQNGQTPTSKKEPVKTTKGIQAKASRDKGK